MNSTTFDVLTRQAGSTQARRTALRALGAAGLGAALATPMAADAKKKKKCKKKVKQKCESQQAGCQAAVDDFCEGNTDCEEFFASCCELLATCDAEAAVACIFNGLAG